MFDVGFAEIFLLALIGLLVLGPERLPGVGAGPIQEWYRAIKGDGPAPGSNFDYSAALTEMVLLGALAQRSGKTIEWDAKRMEVKGQPEFDKWIKEPAHAGWQYGEKL